MRRGAQPLDATGGSTRRPLPFAFARVAGWLIVPLYLAGVCANLWFESRLGLQDEDPFQGVVLLVGFGAFAVVGALMVLKRPANSIGWILAAVAFMVAVFPAGDSYAAYVMRTRGQPDALAVLGAWAHDGVASCAGREAMLAGMQVSRSPGGRVFQQAGTFHALG